MVRITDPFGVTEPITFPAKWPGSEEDKWLMQQSELHAASIVYKGDVKAYLAETMVDVRKLTAAVGMPVGFERMAWNPAVEERLPSCPKEGDRGWARLKEAGFWGKKLPLPPQGEPWHVFEEWRELIALLGQYIYCGRRIAEEQSRL